MSTSDTNLENKSPSDIILDILNRPYDRFKFLFHMDRVQGTQHKVWIRDWNYRTKRMMSLDFKSALRWRQERNITNNVIVIGETGSGKTNVVLTLIVLFMKMYSITNWTLEIGKHLDFDLHKILATFGQNSLIVTEEAHDSFNRYAARSIQNRSLMATLESIRKHNVHFIFVTPNFDNIDMNVFSKAIHWLIIVQENDHENKRVKVRIDYNCKFANMREQDFYEHSTYWFNWVDEQEFLDYDEKVENYGKDSNVKDFKKERREFLQKTKQDIEAEKISKFSKLVSKTRIPVKRDKKREVQIKLARQGFEIGLNKTQVGSILGIGDKKVNAGHARYLQKTRDDKEKGEREQ